jgi:hypothetical protein
VIRWGAISARRIRVFENNPDVDNHSVSKIFIPGDKGIAVLILEADALRAAGTIVETVKVLDCCDYGISRIVRKYLHTHRQARTICRRLGPQKFKGDIFGRWTGLRREFEGSRSAKLTVNLRCVGRRSTITSFSAVAIVRCH